MIKFYLLTKIDNMKNSIFLIFIALFFLASCGGSSAKKSTDETVSTEQIERLDSLSTEMDDVTKEIEDNAKALEDALSDLEN